jgi:hypothetical protein
LKDVSSNTSSYYKFPSSWYEMVYAASDDIWSNINSFNPAGWANVVRPALLRKLIAMAWLRNELQGGMLRDAVWQGKTFIGFRYKSILSWNYVMLS